jgi:hypothetical protein
MIGKPRSFENKNYAQNFVYRALTLCKRPYTNLCDLCAFAAFALK